MESQGTDPCLTPNSDSQLEWRKGQKNEAISSPKHSKFPRSKEHHALRGRVLFLPPLQRVNDYTSERNEKLSPDLHAMYYGDENKEGFSHPVVILSRIDEYRVKCLLLTSFGGQPLDEKHRNVDTRKMYIPIEPSDDHPDSRSIYIPRVKFCFDLGAKTKPGYVVAREPYIIDWRDLELWQDTDPTLLFAHHVQFDEHDMEKIDERLRVLSKEEFDLKDGQLEDWLGCFSLGPNRRFRNVYNPHTRKEYRECEPIKAVCAAWQHVHNKRLNTFRPEQDRCPITGKPFSDCPYTSHQHNHLEDLSNRASSNNWRRSSQLAPSSDGLVSSPNLGRWLGALGQPRTAPGQINCRSDRVDIIRQGGSWRRNTEDTR
ncbi:MAG: hypothetical protein M1822_003547 [Bathelium mastoideum]|nr:MAG: hypothetical protein M1822_003547 [Bathelium mastoideum]